MKSNIKYRGLNSYVLSDKKTMLYKFAMIIILSSFIILVFSFLILYSSLIKCQYI